MKKKEKVFKVGDKVRVKSCEELEKYCKNEKMSFVYPMFSFAGKEGIIVSDKNGIYCCSFDDRRDLWLPEWLEPVEGPSMCYYKGVPRRGEEIKRELLNMGGCIREGLPEYTYEDANFYYFIDPIDKFIYGVEIHSLTGRILKSTWSEKILPKEEETSDPEKEEKYIIIHEGRCMRRIAHGRKEAEHFKKWILKDKPYAKVDVFKITWVEV